MKDLFPEMPRAVAGYLLDYMSRSENGLIAVDKDAIIFKGGRAPLRSGTHAKRYSLASFAAIAGKRPQEILETFCPACDKAVERNSEQYSLDCSNPVCLFRAPRRYTREEKGDIDDKERVCPDCGRIMEFNLLMRKQGCTHNPAGYQHRLRLTESSRWTRYSSRAATSTACRTHCTRSLGS